MEPSTVTTTSCSSNSSHNRASSCRKSDYGGGQQQLQHVAAELQDLDALLAHAGYTVRRSDVRHVAERLEQLQSVLCAAEEAGVCRPIMSPKTNMIHYNPSDVAAWIECMIGELRQTVAAQAAPAAPSAPPSTYNPPYIHSSPPACCLDIPSPTSQLTYNKSHQGCNHGSCSSPAASSCVKGSAAAAGTSSCSIVNVESLSLDVMDELDDLISHYRENGPSTVLPSACSAPLYPQELGQHQELESSTLMHQKKAYTSHDDHQPIVIVSSSQQESNEAAKHYQQQQQTKDRAPQEHCSSGSVDQNLWMMKTQNQRLHQVAYQAPQQQQLLQRQLQQPQAQFHELSAQQADQECGVRVVYLLMACAEAVQQHELKLAHNLVKEIQALSYPQANGPMAKVAAHFVEGLARRIYNINCLHHLQPQTDAYTDLLYFHFYETCPYLKFAHFTANQAILEAFEGHKLVHLIDFSLMQGLQWPVLIQALALRPGGPPARVRLTGIGPPQPDEKDVLQEVGIKLAQLADSVNVEFDFRGVVASKLDDVEPWMLQVQPGEAVAVNSILQLHKLLHCDSDSTVYPTPIDEVLRSVKSLNPKIITVVEQEANHNNPFFLERFMDALQYYCTMFDSIEASAGPAESMAAVLAEMHLGREIVNIVACEGEARLERHEKLSQWRSRMSNAGFRPLHLGSNAFKQTSMLLSLYSGDGYTVQENDGCLTLGWHSHPLLSASAWY